MKRFELNQGYAVGGLKRFPWFSGSGDPSVPCGIMISSRLNLSIKTRNRMEGSAATNKQGLVK